ncbi:MAG: pseudouridine synthase [Planctomycetota bacterium]
MPKPRPKKKAAKKRSNPREAKGAKRPPKRPLRTKPAGGAKRAPRRLAPIDAGERLQKLLAAAGVASRRECELLIAEGRVQVDGVVVTELGARVNPFRQQVHFDGEPLPKRRRVYYAVNKPDGYVSTARDPAGRPRVVDLLPPDLGRVFNVGRLDMASEGLILLTNDGELANRLTHPRHGVEKLYHVQVAGKPTPEALREVRSGVYLTEGKVAFANVRIKSRHKNSTILEVTLDEGRNREIRRVLARVGHKVQKLTRVAVGPVRLGDLPSGAYRSLTRDEVRALQTESKASPDAGSETQRDPKPTRDQRAKRSPKAKRPNKKPAAAKPAARRVIGGEDAAPTTSGGQAKKSKRPGKRPSKATKRATTKATTQGNGGARGPRKKQGAGKQAVAAKRGARRR